MTKKDFEAIAGAVKDARGALGPSIEDANYHNMTRIFDSMSRSLADVCAKTNPRFQRSRFLSACGVADGR